METTTETRETTSETRQDKSIQEDLKESAHRIWLAGLGALAAAEQEGSKMFNRLVERGRDFETKGKTEAKDQYEKAREQFDKAKSQAKESWDNVGGKVDEMVTQALHRLGVPTREEIHTLTQRVEELNSKVEALKPRVTPVVVTPDTPTPNPDAKIVV
jgi:poly(hydroxyalkanoate) granule-associated protein